MHSRDFMLISPDCHDLPDLLLYHLLSLSHSLLLSLSPSLFLSSTVSTWAATWGPILKCRRVSRVWSRVPVAGSHQASHQRGICPWYQSGSCGHLLWFCARVTHAGKMAVTTQSTLKMFYTHYLLLLWPPSQIWRVNEKQNYHRGAISFAFPLALCCLGEVCMSSMFIYPLLSARRVHTGEWV